MGKRIRKKGKGKAPPKPPSGNRDDEEVAERQGLKSMRLVKSSPPANSVLTNDNSNVAMVASGDVEEEISKENNSDSISVNITDVQNKNLFTIDNRGSTTSFHSQSLPKCQENFSTWIEEGHEVRGLLLPQVNTEIILQDRYDAVKATIKKIKSPAPTMPRNSYGDNSDSEGSHQSMPPKKNSPSQELQINSGLERFIEALSHLEPIHYSFHLVGNDISKCCLCSCAPHLTPWRAMFNIAFEKEDYCGNT
jgi:hypothetical protein